MSNVYDYTSALERMGNDEQLFREMAGFVQSDGPRWQGEIRRGFSDRDTVRVHRAAHSLKGLVANLDAHRAVTAAAEVELAARRGDWNEIEGRIPELDSALAELLQAIKSTPQVNDKHLSANSDR